MMGLALACAACSQEKAPAEEVVKAAEKIVAPSAQPTPLAKGKWAPRDTCDGLEGSGRFRRLLAAAVEARDADVLAALAAEDVKLDFGGGAGRAELRRRLADDSLGLWDELDALMALGCSANKQGGITIPWYFDQEMGELDPFETWLVIGEDVPVRARPAADSEPVAAVSWDVVKIPMLDPQEPFQAVVLSDETAGYIATDMLCSLVDFRLIASSRNGRWRVTSFVAGD
jgi:hypothetical protein